MEFVKRYRKYLYTFIFFLKKNKKKVFVFFVSLVLCAIYGTGFLSNLGTFIQGVAALVGIFWVQDAFTQHVRQERSAAACEILNEFKTFDLYVEKITHNPILYTYEGYYPTHIPEVRDPGVPLHEERPLRLIANRIDELKQKINVLMSKIRQKDAEVIAKYMKEIEDIGVRIIDSLHVAMTQEHPSKKISKDTPKIAKDTVKPTDVVSPYKPLEEYGKIIKARVQDIEKILRPIISGEVEY